MGPQYKAARNGRHSQSGARDDTFRMTRDPRRDMVRLGQCTSSLV